MAGAVTFRYHVYLSFLGEDIRRGFASHLYDAISRSGFHVFTDEMLQRGEEIGTAITNAIEESMIAIILFSPSYAFSKWCLEELTFIMDRFNTQNNLRRVFPVFYDVDPSHVRHQTGSYGEAFTRHESLSHMEKVNRWRVVLSQTADLAGFHSEGFRSDADLIGRIVEEVTRIIGYRGISSIDIPLHVVDSKTVGLESRVLQVMRLLNVEADEGVHMVGIHGASGIGKTTIARAVYNFIRDQFEGSCFLEDVKVNSTKHSLVHLQKMVLSAILGDLDVNLEDVKQGILIVKDVLSRKKVLLVLDDVDKIEQLKAVVGGHDWFGSGSRVIIATRDKGLLELHGVTSSYGVDELSDKEARDLLTWNAFKTEKFDPSYTDVLNRAVNYASRLPLDVQVTACYLSEKTVDKWNDALQEYGKIPREDIKMKLKLSFDSLGQYQKQIFLDIACFFNRQKWADIGPILCAHHDLLGTIDIEQLIKNSLMRIDNGRVIIHDLIEDMGREIVQQESPNEPGKRSRLWFFKDVVQVLEQNEGSNTIESLFLDFPKDDGLEGEEVHWDGDAFKNMKNLKTLIIRNGCFNKGPTQLPQNLRVLTWWGYPLPSLPCDFHPEKLAILELPESCIRISEQIQGFMCLAVLDLGHCEYITRIPDVSGLPNLEKLYFRHCENLVLIHNSVGLLLKLRILDVAQCKKLRTFPPIRLILLEKLNLSHCSILKGFPEI